MLNSSLFISYSFIQLNQWRKKPYESKMNWFWFNSIFSLYIFDRQKKAISFKIPDSSSCGQCKKEDKGNRKRTLSNGHWTSTADNRNQDAKQSRKKPEHDENFECIESGLYGQMYEMES